MDENDSTVDLEKAKMTALAEMADVIGHDIKNPLSNIKNGLYFLKKALDSQDARVLRMLEIIDREVVHIAGILENLTGYARQRPPTLRPTAVGEVVEEAIGGLSLPETVKLINRTPSGLPTCNLDRAEIRLVLLNLLSNAVEACESEEGGVVEVDAATDDEGNLRLRISDNGKGMAAAELAEIHKPFTTTKGGHTGLGMAAVKNLVQRHGGRLELSSEVGRGTEVDLRLPIA